jgi:hypothetical protein
MNLINLTNMEKAKYKQSETKTVKRSQINFAPYNPKKHTKDSIDKIKKNIRKVAFLGGIVWNEATGNLIDGHKRIMALDIINRHSEDTPNDYDVKVEAVELDEKTEKEQNIFQTQSRTEFDIELMQILIPEIDYQNAGLEFEDLNYFMVEIPNVYDNSQENDEVGNDFDNLEEMSDIEREMRKQAVKEAKNTTKKKMQDEAQGEPYVTLSFDNFENKVYFMELTNNKITDRFVKGESILKLIENG